MEIQPVFQGKAKRVSWKSTSKATNPHGLILMNKKLYRLEDGGATVREIHTPFQNMVRFATSPDGKMLVLQNAQTLLSFDTTVFPLALRSSRAINEWVCGISFWNNDCLVVCVQNQIWFLNPLTMEDNRDPLENKEANIMAISGSSLWVCDSHGLKVRNLEDTTLPSSRVTAPITSATNYLWLSAANAFVVAARRDEELVCLEIFDSKTRRLLQYVDLSIPIGVRFELAVLNPSMLVVLGSNFHVSSWNVTNNRRILVQALHPRCGSKSFFQELKQRYTIFEPQTLRLVGRLSTSFGKAADLTDAMKSLIRLDNPSLMFLPQKEYSKRAWIHSFRWVFVAMVVLVTCFRTDHDWHAFALLIFFAIILGNSIEYLY